MSVTRRALQQDAAVLRLPDELLLDVFMCTRDAWWDCMEHLLYQESGPPVSYLKCIMAVCKHWRYTASSDPLLWRKIAVDSKWGKEKTRISDLETSLQRSRDVQLDIYINEYYGSSDPLISLLFQHVERCRSLSLVWPTSLLHNTIRPVSLELPGPLTHLTRLRIEGGMAVNTSHEVPRSYLAILSEDNIAPLEHLDLNFLHVQNVSLSSGFANLRTERLRQLSVRCSRPDWHFDVMGLVSRSENLEGLFLWLEVPKRPARIAPFALNKLERFDNCCSSPFVLLQTISMPALGELLISGGCGGWRNGAFTMRVTDVEYPIAGVTLPSLHTLLFELCDFEEDERISLSTFLRANPTIEIIHASISERHGILMSAMLDSDIGHVTLEPRAQSELVDSRDKPEYFQNVMLPNLKMLRISRQQNCLEPKHDRNLASLFSRILSQWEAVHIKVDDWADERDIPELDIREETRELQLLADLHEGRFTYGRAPH